MSILDWIVLFLAIVGIAVYGTWKYRSKQKNISSYLKGNNEDKWYTIGLSIMATQASAITFLSIPGQAFEDGMGFIQFYLGLPIAMIILSAYFLPIYYKLKVYTAYEYLETRFDLKTRLLTSGLFLIQRGLSTGITIYAPAIILSTLLHWPLTPTICFIGLLVILYTFSGGTAAVSHTQTLQMAVIWSGMLAAFFIILNSLPNNIGLPQVVKIAGNFNKLNIIDYNFKVESRYNFWSGLLGGMFVALSYFGTDQSQVQRYISGESLKQSRIGLLFNGLLKIPMQFYILFIGVMLFVFFQFNQQPLFFNKLEENKVKASIYKNDYEVIEKKYNEIQDKKSRVIKNEFANTASEIDFSEINNLQAEQSSLKRQAKELIKKNNSGAEIKDTDYVFISFILNNVPQGLIGLLLAIVFSAAMSSTAGQISGLSSASMVDIYKRVFAKNKSDHHYVKAAKANTVLWGILGIIFALLADRAENLIQAVNILGSLFYGTILGIFVCGFFIKQIKSNAVFYSAILSEIIVIALFVATDIGFLWFNIIGCVLVVIISTVFNTFYKNNKA